MDTLLQSIVLTLEDIEVHGSDNMGKLLGCINALNSIIEQSGQDDKQSTKDGEKLNGEPTD